MSLFLSCIFYSTVKIRKNVLQKEIKDWTYKAYLLTEETSSWFLLIESLKITCARSYVWFLNFYWIVFRDMSYPNSVNNCVLSKVSKREQIRSILTSPKLAKWISTLNCSKSAKWPIWNLYISSHGEARNIKFGQQVNIIERVPSDTPHVKSWLGTSPLGLVTSLPFDYVTLIKLYISSFREATGDTFIHAKA